ncbi:MAG: hypothetical protein GF398_13460 [Chitinivibrionales bacterium]|nr:hypothetical protein [Chitinivibrionales bacterium]
MSASRLKIGWLYPVNRPCGIAYYARKYVAALQEMVELEHVDLDELAGDWCASCARLNRCDIVHIQYETAFFLNKRKDWFPRLCRHIRRPLVVSLHEIYRRHPNVFAREDLPGRGAILALRRALYDYRHPYQTALAKHIRNNFYADLVLVHAQCQKDILIEKQADPECIAIIPYPVKRRSTKAGPRFNGNEPIRLVSTGFINKNFNYALLFEVLERLHFPWQFVWIGGVRLDEDAAVLQELHRKITRNKWQDKFSITGFLAPCDPKNISLMDRAHIYLSLFSARSSSESLATALGAGKLIIATRLPFIQEMVDRFPALVPVEPDAGQVATMINRLTDDRPLRNRTFQAVDDYCAAFSSVQMSRVLCTHYARLAAS